MRASVAHFSINRLFLFVFGCARPSSSPARGACLKGSSVSDLFDYDEKQAARILGVSTRTMKAYRAGAHIGFYRLPGKLGRIRYSTEQLAEFVRSRRVASDRLP